MIVTDGNKLVLFQRRRVLFAFNTRSAIGPTMALIYDEELPSLAISGAQLARTDLRRTYALSRDVRSLSIYKDKMDAQTPSLGRDVRHIPKCAFRSWRQCLDGHRGIVPSYMAPHAVGEWDAKRPGDSQAVGAQE